MISMIVAHDDKRLIGNGNKLPWHITSELKHFKEVTMGKTIIMGRKTFESIGNSLPGRINVVVTRSDDFAAEKVLTLGRLDFLEMIKDKLEKEYVIIGGQQIYEECLPWVHKLYVTEVKGKFKGDAYFPKYKHLFDLESKSEWIKDGEYEYRKMIYKKKEAAG